MATLVRLAVASAIAGTILGAVMAWSLLPSSHEVRVASSQKTFDRPRFVTTSSAGTTLQRVSVEAGSKPVLIQWYDGAWKPLTPRAGCYVQLVLDGRTVGSALLGGRTGHNETRPGWLDWRGRLKSGTHRVEARVYRAEARFAIPFAAAGRRVPDSLFVSELG
jgi:hypothetical protein